MHNKQKTCSVTLKIVGCLGLMWLTTAYSGVATRDDMSKDNGKTLRVPQRSGSSSHALYGMDLRSPKKLAKTIKKKSIDALVKLNFNNLSLLANALSRSPDDVLIRDATTVIARVVLKKKSMGQPDACNVKDWAMLANAFSQFSDEVACQKAFKCIADDIAHYEPNKCLTQDELNKCDIKDLAILANAFLHGRSYDQICCSSQLGVVGAIVQAISDKLNHGLSKLTFEQAAYFAAILHYSRCLSDDYIKPLRTIADMVTAQSRAKLSKLNPEDLANLSVTLYKSYYRSYSNGIPHQNKEAIATAFKNKSFSERSQFRSQDLVKLAKVFASFHEIEEKNAAVAFTKLIADVVIGKSPDALKQFYSRDLADLATIFLDLDKKHTKVIYGPFQPAISAIAHAVASKSSDVLIGFHSETLARLAGIFGQCVHNASCQAGIKAIAHCIKNEPRILNRFDCADLLECVSAFSILDSDVSCQAGIKTIAHFIKNEPSSLNRFNRFDYHSLAQLTRALSALVPEDSGKLANKVIANFIKEEARNNRIAYYGIEALCDLFNAFHKWPHEAPFQEAMQAIVELTKNSLELQLQFQSQCVPPRDLSSLIDILSKFPDDIPLQAVTKSLANLIGRSADIVSASSIKVLCDLANIFSKWSHKLPFQGAMQAIVEEINNRLQPGRTTTLPPRDLPPLIDILKKFPDDVAFQTVVKALASLISQDNYMLSASSIKVLCDLTNIFSKWSHKVPFQKAMAGRIAWEIIMKLHRECFRVSSDLDGLTPQDLPLLIDNLKKFPNSTDFQRYIQDITKTKFYPVNDLYL